MGHDWVFEVLSDMKAYADRHGLVALAAKVDETLDVARAEILSGQGGDDKAVAGGRGRSAARRGPSRRN